MFFRLFGISKYEGGCKLNELGLYLSSCRLDPPWIPKGSRGLQEPRFPDCSSLLRITSSATVYDA
jgi:hypothetical protein